MQIVSDVNKVSDSSWKALKEVARRGRNFILFNGFVYFFYAEF